MNHPKLEEWSDHLRGVLEPDSAAALEAHRSRGCAACERHIEALRAVMRVGEVDLRVQPPASAVRGAKSLLRIQRLVEASEPKSLGLALSFDSFLSAAGAGVRTVDSGRRHLVFRSPRLLVDLELHPVENGKPVGLRGQLLDGESRPLADVPAFLLDRGRISSQDLSGRVGDFNLRADPRSAPRLCLVVGDDLVEVPLPDRLLELEPAHPTH